MMENSKIAWTTHTFNPWMGCTKVSEGCKYCYAETLIDKRWKRAKWGPSGDRVKTSASYWNNPIHWNKIANETGTRPRVFCASLADVFEDNPTVANWRGELFQLIEKTPNLDWLILTKRADRIFSLGTDAVGEIFDLWLERNPNVWIGVSAEHQAAYDERVPKLLSIGARIRFVSIEPMLGPISIPVGIKRSNNPDWVIIGGESGKGCRPMDITWVYDLAIQCGIKNIPVFIKQLGGYPDKRDRLDDLPEILRERRFPK